MQSARWLDQKVQDRTVMSCLAGTVSVSNRARAFETLAQYVKHFHGAAHAFSQPGHYGLSAQEIPQASQTASWRFRGNLRRGRMT